MEVWSDVRPEGALAIENELTQALVLELDRVALRGSGVAPEPRGVRKSGRRGGAVAGRERPRRVEL